MRLTAPILLAACLTTLSGCHSAYIETTVINRTADVVPLIEVDYPSASFGTQNLEPGASFHYRFKVLGSGPTKLLYTDSTHHDHASPGPTLAEGQEGQLNIAIEDATTQWNLTMRKPSKK